MLLLLLIISLVEANRPTYLKCEDLYPGQYICNEPEIENTTQAEKGCRVNRTVLVECWVVPGLQCDGEDFSNNQTGFLKEVPCRYVAGTSFNTALLLSVFLGMFGIDRFYLGYPAIGLFKFCTFGFFMIFQFIDILLIAAQVLKPADGSDYLMDYFGHRLIHVTPTEDTYRLPP